MVTWERIVLLILPSQELLNENNAYLDTTVEPNSWKCNEGYYMNPSKTACNICPNGTNTHGSGALRLQDCICNEHNQYLQASEDGGSVCTPCPGDRVRKSDVILNGTPDNDCGCDIVRRFFDDGSNNCIRCIQENSELVDGRCECMNGYQREQIDAENFRCVSSCNKQCGIYKKDRDGIISPIEFVNSLWMTPQQDSTGATAEEGGEVRDDSLTTFQEG